MYSFLERLVVRKLMAILVDQPSEFFDVNRSLTPGARQNISSILEKHEAALGSLREELKGLPWLMLDTRVITKDVATLYACLTESFSRVIHNHKNGIATFIDCGVVARCPFVIGLRKVPYFEPASKIVFLKKTKELLLTGERCEVARKFLGIPELFVFVMEYFPVDAIHFPGKTIFPKNLEWSSLDEEVLSEGKYHLEGISSSNWIKVGPYLLINAKFPNSVASRDKKFLYERATTVLFSALASIKCASGISSGEHLNFDDLLTEISGNPVWDRSYREPLLTADETRLRDFLATDCQFADSPLPGLSSGGPTSLDQGREEEEERMISRRGLRQGRRRENPEEDQEGGEGETPREDVGIIRREEGEDEQELDQSVLLPPSDLQSFDPKHSRVPTIESTAQEKFTGILGEYFVYKKLRKIYGENFGVTCWKSSASLNYFPSRGDPPQDDAGYDFEVEDVTNFFVPSEKSPEKTPKCFIEVKSTHGPFRNNFFISANEIRTLRECSSDLGTFYILLFVEHVGDPTKTKITWACDCTSSPNLLVLNPVNYSAALSIEAQRDEARDRRAGEDQGQGRWRGRGAGGGTTRRPWDREPTQGEGQPDSGRTQDREDNRGGRREFNRFDGGRREDRGEEREDGRRENNRIGGGMDEGRREHRVEEGRGEARRDDNRFGRGGHYGGRDGERGTDEGTRGRWGHHGSSGGRDEGTRGGRGVYHGGREDGGRDEGTRGGRGGYRGRGEGRGEGSSDRGRWR
jgi:hypothetical protein